MNVFRYWYLRLRHPHLSDFLGMGNGIDARSRRVARYWQPHLELSRRFQRDAIKGSPSSTGVTVLGAGRLLDVDVPFLCERSGRLVLVDADPGAVAHWKRSFGTLSGMRLEPKLIELTGVLARWDESLSAIVGKVPDYDKLVDLLLSLRAEPEEHLALDTPIVVSLNLLSQIPLYWRDRIQQLIASRWGADLDDKISKRPDLAGAVTASMSMLQRQHVAALCRSKAEKLVLLFDRVFYFYLPTEANWIEEFAVPGGKVPEFAGWRIEAKDSWLWHLAPYGIERHDYGSIHEVVALNLVPV